jgi:hypothetical protein
MGLDKLGSQIRAKIKSSNDFKSDSFKTKSVDVVKGISIIAGNLKDQSNLTTHSYCFDIEKGWDITKVKTWLHDQKIDILADDSESLEFAELDNIEIFATGKWNGHEFSEIDLDNLIDSFKQIGSKIQPYLKLGHNKEQELARNSGLVQSDGLPALGWVHNLRRIGSKLVADFKDVPRVVADLVRNKAYKRVSSELYVNYGATKEEHGGAPSFPLVLKAVSLLGGDTPAVTNLNDVLALYTGNKEGETVKTFEFTNADFKEDKMSEKKEEIDFEKQIADLEVKFAANEAAFKAKEAEFKKSQDQYNKVLDKFSKSDDLVKFIDELNAKETKLVEQEKEYTKIIKDSKLADVKLFSDKLLNDNRILPVQKDVVEKLLLHADSSIELEFTKDESFGLKEKMSFSDTFKALLSSFPDMGTLKEFSSSKDEKVDIDAERVKLTKEYQEEYKLDFGKAQAKLSKDRPELF